MKEKNFTETLSEFLFKTEALKVSPSDDPFIYTSGKLGPFYINTHFLYGSKEAKELLSYINKNLDKNNRKTLPKDLLYKTTKNYEDNNIYKAVIDRMVSELMLNYDLHNIDYISGGERRDWFFSLLIAKLINKPHISIFKDKSIIISKDNDIVSQEIDFSDKQIIHICDLVTEASSFENIWYPVINENNNLKCAMAVVDRNQGGEEYFKQIKVDFISLIKINIQFFLNALSKGYIDINQYTLIDKYSKHPKETIKDMLLNHPSFLKQKVSSKDDKTKKRIKKLLTENFYGLPENIVKKHLKRL